MADTDPVRCALTGAVTDRMLWKMLARSATEARGGRAFAARGFGKVLAKAVSVHAGTASLLSVQMLERSSSSREGTVLESETSVPEVDGLAPCGSGIHVLSMTHFFAVPEGFRLIVFRGGLFGRSSSSASKLRGNGHWVLSYCMTCANTALNCAIFCLSSSVS